MNNNCELDSEIMEDTITQIQSGNCTPIISDQLVLEMLFGKNVIAPKWAEQTKYPLSERDSLPSIAQFVSLRKRSSALTAKRQYLAFLKTEFIAQERKRQKLAQSSSPPVGAEEVSAPNLLLDLDMMEPELMHSNVSFSDVVIKHLQYKGLEKDANNPLLILAGFDIKRFFTTSPHFFLEHALSKKRIHPKVYRWKAQMEDIPEDYSDKAEDHAADGKVYKPSVEEPLVYHLFGIDEQPSSMVLTEDDYFEFLLEARDNFKEVGYGSSAESGGVPSYVRNAITSGTLLLMGYEIDSWDLRVILRGLVQQLERNDNNKSVAIQFDSTRLEKDGSRILDPEVYREYLENSFEHIKFNVIWADPNVFLAELKRKLG